MPHATPIYFDHAATTPVLPEAFAAMEPFLRGSFGNPSSPHGFGREARLAVEKARSTIAACLHASTEEIFFTSGGSEANNWVLRNAGNNILVSSYEHHSILNTAIALHPSTAFIKPKMHGSVTPECLRKAWRDGVDLVSVMTANNEIGTLNPIAELCAEAHKRNALFHTDAVQAVGHILIDVKELDIDYLSASAHKFGGPKGVGFLYAKNGKTPTPLLYGGHQENGHRASTENVAGIVGMATALRVNCERMAATTAHLTILREDLVTGLRTLFPDAQFLGEQLHSQLPGFVSVVLPGHPSEGMLHILDLKGIAVSAGAACDSRRTQISHVLKAIRLPKSLAECTLRITLGAENTSAEVQRCLAVLKQCRQIAATH